MSNLVLQLGNFIEVCTKHLHPLDVVVPGKNIVSISIVLGLYSCSTCASCNISPMQARDATGTAVASNRFYSQHPRHLLWQEVTLWESNQALRPKYKNCFWFQLHKTRSRTGIKVQLQSSHLSSHPLLGKNGTLPSRDVKKSKSIILLGPFL